MNSGSMLESEFVKNLAAMSREACSDDAVADQFLLVVRRCEFGRILGVLVGTAMGSHTGRNFEAMLHAQEVCSTVYNVLVHRADPALVARCTSAQADLAGWLSRV